jgi:hypothetical protein
LNSFQEEHESGKLAQALYNYSLSLTNSLKDTTRRASGKPFLSFFFYLLKAKESQFKLTNEKGGEVLVEMKAG